MSIYDLSSGCCLLVSDVLLLNDFNHLVSVRGNQSIQMKPMRTFGEHPHTIQIVPGLSRLGIKSMVLLLKKKCCTWVLLILVSSGAAGLLYVFIMIYKIVYIWIVFWTKAFCCSNLTCIDLHSVVFLGGLQVFMMLIIIKSVPVYMMLWEEGS